MDSVNRLTSKTVNVRCHNHQCFSKGQKSFLLRTVPPWLLKSFPEEESARKTHGSQRRTIQIPRGGSRVPGDAVFRPDPSTVHRAHSKPVSQKEVGGKMNLFEGMTNIRVKESWVFSAGTYCLRHSSAEEPRKPKMLVGCSVCISFVAF